MASLYREFHTQAELDAEYDVEGTVPDFPAYLERFEAESRRALAELNPTLGISYGPTVEEYLDIFPAREPKAPVLIFFHGGYWRRLAGRDFAFAALGPTARGITVVNVNYALCPQVTIDEIVRQARSAVSWTRRSIAGYGGDPDRLYVGGHSAGAHLAAMCLLTRWERDYALPRNLLKGGTLISGLYDLRPLPFTFIQPALQLTWRQIWQCSPLLASEHIEAPVLIAYGERESAEFCRQSLALAEASAHAGSARPRVLAQEGRDHFSAVLDLTDAQSPLSTAIAELVAPHQDPSVA